MLASASTRVKSCAPAAADLQQPLKEFRRRAGTGPSVLRETGRTGLQRAGYSQELTVLARFLYLLISRKALESFMVRTLPSDQQRLHGTSRKPL